MGKADLKLDTATGDFSFANGDIELVYDDAELRQRLKLRLEDNVGDWFRDLSAGTDWFGSILGKRSNLTRRAELSQRVLGTDGVASIQRLDLTLSGRALTVEIEAIREEGGTIAVQFTDLLGGA
jgi:hypothetical protein